MQFSVGLPLENRSFESCILKNREHVREVYFSWWDFPSGRSAATGHRCEVPWQQPVLQEECLGRLSDAGISLNLLLNANCYGAQSQSRAFFRKIGQTVEYLGANYALDSVTTTSPLIARFLREHYPQLKTRASVNMEIGTVQGMEYLAEFFDGYYMKRELNRDPDAIRPLHQWCKSNGKTLHFLANSGCLNHCSAHNFHDNLVAHEQEIAQMDNLYQFSGICREYLRDPGHYESLIRDTNFVRPEDIAKYDPWFDTAKLATRVHRCPEAVLESYIRGKFSGNILDLLEPAHSIFPYVVENGDPLRIVKIGD